MILQSANNLYFTQRLTPKKSFNMKKKGSLFFCFTLFCLTAICQTPVKDSTEVEYATKDSVSAGPKGVMTPREKDIMPKTLKPTEGMALVYIIRRTAFATLIRMSVKCDSIRIGSTMANNYVYAMLPPGMHTLVSTAENHGSLDIMLEAGKTYYIKQQVKMGFAYAETGLKQMDDPEGQKDLQRCRLAKDNAASK